MDALARRCGAVLALLCTVMFFQPGWGTCRPKTTKDSSPGPGRSLTTWAFVARYTQQRSLPEYVQEIATPISSPPSPSPTPEQYRDGEWGLTNNTRGIGKGYPSFITFGPRMFSPAFNVADFESVLQHEAVHARYWPPAD